LKASVASQLKRKVPERRVTVRDLIVVEVQRGEAE
jgi:hypothetical protein